MRFYNKKRRTSYHFVQNINSLIHYLNIYIKIKILIIFCHENLYAKTFLYAQKTCCMYGKTHKSILCFAAREFSYHNLKIVNILKYNSFTPFLYSIIKYCLSKSKHFQVTFHFTLNLHTPIKFKRNLSLW